MKLCGAPISSESRGFELDTVEKQKVRAYHQMTENLISSKSRLTRKQALSSIISYFMREIKAEKPKKLKNLSNQILKLSKQHIKILKISECKIENSSGINQRIASLLYQVFFFYCS